MRERTNLALLLMLWVIGAAAADERTLPRQPIGPPQDFQMMPVQKSPVLPANNIRIVNKGDQKLSFSYWDGQSEWRPQSIDVEASTDISCTICSGAIIVSYHDGNKNQSVTLKGGGTYWLGWSASKGVWQLSYPPN
jgi:hypothetical protein